MKSWSKRNYKKLAAVAVLKESSFDYNPDSLEYPDSMEARYKIAMERGKTKEQKKAEEF